jgi:hypothetical protein
MPALVRYQLVDGPHAGEPTTERGEIERLARGCQAAACCAGLDSIVIETRFTIVRSSMPEAITTVRKLRDYLPPVEQRGGVMKNPDLADITHTITTSRLSRGGVQSVARSKGLVSARTLRCYASNSPGVASLSHAARPSAVR